MDVGFVPSLYSKMAEDELNLQRPKKIIKNTPGRQCLLTCCNSLHTTKEERKLAAPRASLEKLHVCTAHIYKSIARCCFSMVLRGCGGLGLVGQKNTRKHILTEEVLQTSHLCSTLSITCPLMSGLVHEKAWGQIFTLGWTVPAPHNKSHRIVQPECAGLALPIPGWGSSLGPGSSAAPATPSTHGIFFIFPFFSFIPYSFSCSFFSFSFFFLIFFLLYFSFFLLYF